MNAVRITFALLYLGRTEQARSHKKVQTQFRVLPPDVWAAKFQILSNLEECIRELLISGIRDHVHPDDPGGGSGELEFPGLFRAPEIANLRLV